jgi:hypothetical protein
VHLISRNPRILQRDIDIFALSGIPMGNVPDGLRFPDRALRDGEERRDSVLREEVR